MNNFYLLGHCLRKVPKGVKWHSVVSANIEEGANNVAIYAVLFMC